MAIATVEMGGAEQEPTVVDRIADAARHAVKRQPLKAIGISVGIGLVLGVAVVWVGARFGHRDSSGNC